MSGAGRVRRRPSDGDAAFAVSTRRARPVEASLLTDIARAAKASWAYPEEWLKEWAPELAFSAGYIASNPVFVVEVRDGSRDGVDEGAFDREPVGVVALEDGKSGPEIVHLWVLPAYQGSGLGRILVERAVREAHARGWPSLRILSDPNAAPFYERMGAVRVGSHPAPVAGRPRELPVFSLPVDPDGDS